MNRLFGNMFGKVVTNRELVERIGGITYVKEKVKRERNREYN